MGETLNQFIQQRRIEKAAGYLIGNGGSAEAERAYVVGSARSPSREVGSSSAAGSLASVATELGSAGLY